MAYSPGFSYDIGPYVKAPTLYNYFGSTYRNITGPNTIKKVEWYYVKQRDEDPPVPPPEQVLITNPVEGDVWLTDVGLILYSPDGLGGYTPSGYSLTWQHRNSGFIYIDGSLVFYNIEVRLVKQNITNPLDMEILATTTVATSVGSARGASMIFTQCCAYFESYDPETQKTYYGLTWGGYYSAGNATVLSMGGMGISEEWFINNGYKFTIRVKDDPNDDPDNPPDEEEGGGGSHDKPDYPIPKPGLPSITAAAAGFLTLYKLTPAEMSVFADDCLASDAWEAIKLLFANPIEFIVGCSIVPFTPPGNTVWKPKFGTVVFPHWYTRIDNQYLEIDCGDLYIKPFGKNFLDYAPFTRITIFLPYIGFRELDVNEIMGKTINVTYHCDCLSGDCIAFISTSLAGDEGPQIPKVLATFNGNCACQVPFASQSFNSLIASSVNMLANVASSVVKGDLPAVSGSGVIGALEALGGDVQKSGSIGSSNGYMGVQKPYIIKHIPKDSIPSAYRTLKGYPSNISGVLGSFSGYAEIDNIDLTNISTGLGGIVATSAELEEIQALLRGGVFI